MEVMSPVVSPPGNKQLIAEVEATISVRIHALKKNNKNIKGTFSGGSAKG